MKHNPACQNLSKDVLVVHIYGSNMIRSNPKVVQATEIFGDLHVLMG